MELIVQHHRKIIIGTAIGAAIGMWFFSDLTSRQHSPSTIKAPSPRDPEYNLYFKNRQNMWIYTKRWLLTDQNPKGLVFLIHGMGEHCSRNGYQYFASQLNKVGFAVFSLDHQGHGNSNGSRAHVRSISDLCDDFEQYFQIITKQYPDTPCFALGHSMGGLILMSTVIRKGAIFNGIILSAPATFYVNPVPFQSILLKLIFMISLIIPKFPAFRLSIDGISRNSRAREDYLKDPLVANGIISFSSLSGILQEFHKLEPLMGRLTIPVLIVHGSGDTIVHPENSRHLYQNIGSLDKEILILPEVKHELWEDPERDEIEEQLIGWMERRLDQ